MRRKDFLPISFCFSLLFHCVLLLLLGISGYLVKVQQTEQVIYVEAVELMPQNTAQVFAEDGDGQPTDGTAAPAFRFVGERQRDDTEKVSETKQGMPLPNTDATINSTASNSTETQLNGQGTSSTYGVDAVNSTGNSSTSSGGMGIGGGNTTSNGSGNGLGVGNEDVDQSAAASGEGNGHYDEAAIEKEIQGSVTVRGLLNADGSISNVSVIASSGNATIDNMGVRDMYGGSYRPARDRNGKPIASYVTKTFSYRLE